MARTLSREVISTRQQKIVELARMEPKVQLRIILDQRVRDGVFTVVQRNADPRSRMREFRTSGSVGAPGW